MYQVQQFLVKTFFYVFIDKSSRSFWYNEESISVIVRLQKKLFTKDCYFSSILMRIFIKNFKIKNCYFCTLYVYPIWAIISQTGYYIPFRRLVPTSSCIHLVCHLFATSAWMTTTGNASRQRRTMTVLLLCFSFILVW